MPGFIQIVKNNLFNRVVNDHQVMGSLDFIQQLCVEQLYARYSTFVIHYSTLVYSRSSPIYGQPPQSEHLSHML